MKNFLRQQISPPTQKVASKHFKKPIKTAVKRVAMTTSSLGSAVLSRLERILDDDLLLSVAVLFLPILYAVAAFSLITNIGLGRWVLPIGLLLFIISVLALHRQEKWQKLVVTISSFLLIFALVVWATSQALDLYWDSRDYHAKAILILLDGINPFYEPLKWDTFAYPAAHWLLSSSLILWTNSFEASFALTAPAIVAAFICSWRFLKSLHAIPRNWRLILALLLAANPIAIWCLFTHYSDGLFVSLLLSSFMLMLAFATFRNNINTRYHAIYILASLILLVNIKFTALIFGAVLGITVLAYGIITNSRSRQARNRLLKLTGLGTMAVGLAVLLFGFFPYATNMIEFQNPFYPAVEERLIINARFEPEFINKSYYEKWWIALFSQEGRGWFKPAPLPPFSSISPNSFLRGFGSFFSGAMLLSMTILLFTRSKGAWLILIGVILSIFITEFGFYPRLAPQNWWIPILIFICFLVKDNKAGQKSRPLPQAPKIMATIITACLLQSSISTLIHHVKDAAHIEHRVAELREQGGWSLIPDLDLPDEYIDNFFAYYQSELTGIGLPTIAECPIGAERQKIRYGLLVCRP